MSISVKTLSPFTKIGLFKKEGGGALGQTIISGVVWNTHHLKSDLFSNISMFLLTITMCIPLIQQKWGIMTQYSTFYLFYLVDHLKNSFLLQAVFSHSLFSSIEVNMTKMRVSMLLLSRKQSWRLSFHKCLFTECFTTPMVIYFSLLNNAFFERCFH